MKKAHLYRKFLRELAEASPKGSMRELAQRYRGKIHPDLGKVFFSGLREIQNTEVEEFFTVALQLVVRISAFNAALGRSDRDLPIRFAEEALARLPSTPGLLENIKLVGLVGDWYANRKAGDSVANLTAALHAYERALDLCTPSTDRSLTSLLWQQQGDLFGELGSIGAGKRTQDQIACYERALEAQDDPHLKADIMLDLGLALEALSDADSLQRAWAFYNAAYEQIDLHGYSDLRARAAQALGCMYLRSAKDMPPGSEREVLIAKGRAGLEEALCLLDSNEPLRPHVCRQLADAWITTSRSADAVSKAVQLVREAACLLESSGTDEFVLLQCYSDIAGWYETELNDWMSAKPWYELAYPLLIGWMRKTEDSTAVLSANLYNHQVYRGLVSLRIKEERIADAFEIQGRTTHLIDRLIGFRMRPPAGSVTRSTWARFRKRRQRYLEASDAISENDGIDRVAILQQEKEHAYALYQDALEGIRRQDPTLSGLLRGDPLSAPSAQKALRPNEALIAIYPTNMDTIAFVIRGGPENVQPLGLSIAGYGIMEGLGETLFTWVLEYESYRAEGIHNLQRLETLRGALRRAVEYYSTTLDLKRVLPLLKSVDHLVVVAHYPLQFVPLHILNVDGDRTLLDLFNVSFLPSTNILAATRRKPPLSRRSAMLAISDPRPYPPWHLSYSNLEVNAAGRLFESSVILQQDEADINRVVAAIGSAELAHFSCHGVHTHGNVLKSALLLAFDRQLTLEQIFDDVDLGKLRHVTLSACESGLSDAFDFGDAGLSFPAAFLCGGVGSVVSSLWQIEERATTLVMWKFYSHLLKVGGSPSNALRRAQLWLRDATGELLATEARRLLAVDGLRAEPPGLSVWADRQASPTRRMLKPYNDPFYWGAFYHTGL
jgi:CHAT domain-containing protein